MINYQPDPDIPHPWDPDDEDEQIASIFFIKY